MERMQELVGLLNEAARAYYQEDRTIMSDFEYDKLYDELLRLEEESGTVLSGSPTHKVGYEVLSTLTKVRHESRMLSLDKTKEVSRLEEFLGDNEGVLSYKMDGLTTVITYKNGEMVQAVTRGNGEIGEDITHNARVFKNLPMKIPFKGDVVIRGESVISFKEFERINESIDEEERYKNPRNLCSGTVRQLNNEIAKKRNVCFVAFSLVKAEGAEFGDLKSEGLNMLDEMGFQTVKRKRVRRENVADAVKEFEKGISENEFATDGLVLTYDSIGYSEGLGETAKFPRDSIAFKWRDETSNTILREIIWNTSRTGLINPIAVFDPVELEGTTVSRASLHNVSIVEDLRLGIGDEIVVYKANMIIPQVAENLTKSANAKIPEKCAVCAGETEIIKLKDGKALKCTNPNCRAQLVMSIVHYASRDAMNIEGLSEATIHRFIEKGFIENYTDLYEIEKYRDEIINMEGFGEKSFEKLINAIEKSKKVQLPNFIYALGINNVGLSNAKLLVKEYGSDINAIMNAKTERLTEIEGFGDVIARSLVRYFSHKENISLIEKVLRFLEIEEQEENTGERILEGKIFVITGDVFKFKNRKEMQAKIEELGGKATGSVSSRTNYLINNDANSASSKNKKAKELGIPIITEDEFLKMIGREE